jgi:AbrB family looped-hinge helix DNA binding protein
MKAIQTNLTLAANGRVVIPANMRAALGLRDGGKLVARLVDGAIILEPVDAAIRRAQAMVARYASGSPSLVDELIAERRAAANGFGDAAPNRLARQPTLMTHRLPHSANSSNSHTAFRGGKSSCTSRQMTS